MKKKRADTFPQKSHAAFEVRHRLSPTYRPAAWTGLFPAMRLWTGVGEDTATLGRVRQDCLERYGDQLVRSRIAWVAPNSPETIVTFGARHNFNLPMRFPTSL